MGVDELKKKEEDKLSKMEGDELKNMEEEEGGLEVFEILVSGGR